MDIELKNKSNNSESCSEIKTISHELDRVTSLSCGNSVDEHLEKILCWAQTKFGEEELIHAKEEFFWKTGKVFYDDPFFEQRMAYFLDYFLLERPLSITSDSLSHMTPLVAYLKTEPQENEDQDDSNTLTEHTHSIFQVIKAQKHELSLKSLIDGQKIVVSARPLEEFNGISKKDVFQGFVYKTKEAAYLSHGLVFHPEKAVKIVRKELKKSKKIEGFDHLKALCQLAKHNLKSLRHAHVEPKRIYGELILNS